MREPAADHTPEQQQLLADIAEPSVLSRGGERDGGFYVAGLSEVAGRLRSLA